MNTKSTLRVALVVLSVSCTLLARADLLPDPLGPLPKDVSRAAKANVTAAATPANTGTPNPAPAPAPPPALATALALALAAPAASPAPFNATSVTSVTPAAAPAQALTPPAPATHERLTFTNTSGQTLRDLDKWRTQNALLAEMVKAAEMSAKLSNPGTSAGPSGTTPSSSLAFQVLSVDGVDDKLTAVVTLTNGTTFKAREGLTIPGLGKVKSISRDEVIVTTKGGPRLLDFAPKGTLSGVR